MSALQLKRDPLGSRLNLTEAARGPYGIDLVLRMRPQGFRQSLSMPFLRKPARRASYVCLACDSPYERSQSDGCRTTGSNN